MAAIIARSVVTSACRLDPDQRGIVLLGEDVQVAIRTLPNVADALAELAQHRLAADLLPLVIEFDPGDLPRARALTLPQAADEDVSLPAGEPVTRIEGHPRQRNRRHPDDPRLLHPLLPGVVGHLRPGVAAPIADHRP